MRTTGAMRAPTRRRFPLAPPAFGAVIAVAAVVGRLALSRDTSSAPGSRATVQAGSQDAEDVVRSQMEDSLRYRMALARADVEGGDVLGGRVVRDTRRDAVVARILRYFPALTVREVAGMRFGTG